MLLSMLIGAGIGWLIGSAIAAYIEEAINWFRNIWNNHPDFRKNCKAICALVKQGYKAVKRILKIDSSGTSIEEEYYVTGDEGEESSSNRKLCAKVLRSSQHVTGAERMSIWMALP